MLVRGDEDQLGARLGVQLVRGAQAVAARHLHVQQHEIRQQPRDRLDRLPVRRPRGRPAPPPGCRRTRPPADPAPAARHRQSTPASTCQPLQTGRVFPPRCTGRPDGNDETPTRRPHENRARGHSASIWLSIITRAAPGAVRTVTGQARAVVLSSCSSVSFGALAAIWIPASFATTRLNFSLILIGFRADTSTGSGSAGQPRGWRAGLPTSPAVLGSPCRWGGPVRFMPVKGTSRNATPASFPPPSSAP